MRFSLSIILAFSSDRRCGRNFDSKYPPWETVFCHFTQFKLQGIWEQILDYVTEMERKRQGREATPSLLAIDSQSVKKPVKLLELTGAKM